MQSQRDAQGSQFTGKKERKKKDRLLLLQLLLLATVVLIGYSFVVHSLPAGRFRTTSRNLFLCFAHKKTAYFVLPKNVKHGDGLTCSHPLCQKKGIRFAYCKVCDVPVAKINFSTRHKHDDAIGTLGQSTSSNSSGVASSGRSIKRTSGDGANDDDADKKMAPRSGTSRNAERMFRVGSGPTYEGASQYCQQIDDEQPDQAKKRQRLDESKGGGGGGSTFAATTPDSRGEDIDQKASSSIKSTIANPRAKEGQGGDATIHAAAPIQQQPGKHHEGRGKNNRKQKQTNKYP